MYSVCLLYKILKLIIIVLLIYHVSDTYTRIIFLVFLFRYNFICIALLNYLLS